MIARILRSFRKPKVDLRCVDPEFLRKTHRGADWSGKRFSSFVPVGCVFESCSFEGCYFADVCFGGGLEDSRYLGCSFDRVTIRAVAPGNARFESCSFRNVEIIELFGRCIEMVDCEVSGIVRKAFFNGTVPPDIAPDLRRNTNAFEGNDFSNATLIDVDFRTGIDLSKQKFPVGWRNEA
jgi:uncharacterized protein YjbI with pentapeptide repeats